MVWYPLWSWGVIGAYFFENDDVPTANVNLESCGHMITNFFCLLLKNAIWRTRGFNKTVLHATQLERILPHCKKHFLAGFDTIRIFLCVCADKPSTLSHLKAFKRSNFTIKKTKISWIKYITCVFFYVNFWNHRMDNPIFSVLGF